MAAMVGSMCQLMVDAIQVSTSWLLVYCFPVLHCMPSTQLLLPFLLVDWQAPWSAREAYESYAAPKVISGHGLMFESAAQAGNKQAEEDARRVGQYSPSEKVESAQQLAGRLLTTVYMGTVNSSRETKDRAAALARQVLSLGTDSGHRSWTEHTCSWQL